jgi:glutathione synthase/RimK-type ligase-like ATP-grasp enzyme
MSTMRIALATCATLPSLHEDDQLLATALLSRGLEVTPWIWDRPAPEKLAGCVIRSTWDYTFRRQELLAWADRVEVPLWNPAPILRWNSHKGYLAELAARGAPVVPTEIVRVGENLERLQKAWPERVVKPCVSAGARDTYRLRQGDPTPPLDAARDWMVQPYLPAVEQVGERSLIFIDGELTHAVRKHPALAVPRAPEGGEPSVTPDADEIDCARRILGLLGERLLYARVDLLRGEDGRPLLMELEVLEPSLFFRACPAAAEAMADAVVRRLESRSNIS